LVSLEDVPLLLLIELMKERCASLPDALSSWQPVVVMVVVESHVRSTPHQKKAATC
jgi:hypothetical protein